VSLKRHRFAGWQNPAKPEPLFCKPVGLEKAFGNIFIFELFISFLS